jgi:branched-chain amino acid transport system permease protein
MTDGKTFGQLTVLAAIVLALVPLGVGKYPLFVLTVALVYSISTLGLNLAAGYGGQHSFGHGAFMLAGAYAVAIGCGKWALPFPAALLLGVVLAAILGIMVGLPAIRLVGFALAIVSFAFGVTAHSLIKAFDYTGGPTGLFVSGLRVSGIDFRKPLPLYYLAAAVFVAGLVVAQSIATSGTGRALRSIAQSELVSRTLGINPVRYKLFVFVASAVYGAMAGGLLAASSGYVAPETYGPDLSIFMFAAVVIGGMRSQAGAIFGAFFIGVIPELTQATRESSEIVFAVVFALVATLAPRGIWGLVSDGWQRLFRRVSDASPMAPDVNA